MTATPAGAFASFGRNPAAPVRLLCLPHAGGSCAAFRGWPARLPGVDVLAAQLPGRGARFAEAVPDSLVRAAGAVADAVEPWLDRPYAVFGHCLGALLGYEVARQLRDRGRPEPVRLFVSSSVAPHLTAAEPRISELPPAPFRAAVLALGGTAAALAANDELLDLLLPVVRADFRLGETYRVSAATPLTCPITAFAGRDDRPTNEAFQAWGHHTTGVFELITLEGGHFALDAALPEVIALVQQRFGPGTPTGAGPATRRPS